MDRTQEIIINSLWDDNTQINKAVLNIKPEYFTNPVLKDIYQKTVKVYTKDKAVDSVSISGLYPELFDEVYGITQLTSTFNLKPFYGRIRESFKKYKLEKLSFDIKGMLEQGCDSRKVTENIAEIMVDMSDHTTKKPQNIKQMAEAHLSIFENNKEETFTTGIRSLDQDFNLKNGQVCVIAGRPGDGKSLLLNTIARNMCLYQNSVGLIFNYEMLNTENMTRLYSSVGDISLQYFSEQKLFNSSTEREKYMKTADFFKEKEKSLHYIDDPRLNINDVYAYCKIYKDIYNIDFVGIDYLQLMPKLDFKMDDRRAIEHNSRELKRIANELQLKMFPLSQLSRKIEDRKGDERRPKLSDLRESGAIEQDADKVIFPFPTHKHNNLTFAIGGGIPKPSEGEIFIGKNRQGQIRVGKVFNNFDKARFEDVAENRAEEIQEEKEIDTAWDKVRGQ